MSDAEAAALLRQLQDALAQSDTSAGDLVGRLRDFYRASPRAAQLEDVAAAIEGFDFEQALAHLHRLLDDEPSGLQVQP